MGKVNTAKRGTLWEYRFEAAKIGGGRKRISKGGFRTKAEALAAGAKAMAEYNEAGLHFTPSELSFNDFLDHWMDTYCMVNLKDMTIANYKRKLRLHIKPELGMYKLKALTPTVLQKFINKMANDNYARNTLSTIKGILSGCLNFALQQNLIRLNPMNNVFLPSARNEKIQPRSRPSSFIPQNRIKEIFARFPEGTSPYIPMMLAYKGGLRLGEAFGITWDDVDFDAGTIRVNQQVQWDEKVKVWYFSDPKYNSYRTLTMDLECMELLKREKARQEKAKAYYEEHYTDYFVNDKRQLNTAGDGKLVALLNVRENGEQIVPRIMQHTSNVIHYELKYKDFAFHGLRHTHATMLAENDVPPKYLQDRMGHANLHVTMKVYLHTTEKMTEQGDEILQKMFSPGEEQENE